MKVYIDWVDDFPEARLTTEPNYEGQEPIEVSEETYRDWVEKIKAYNEAQREIDMMHKKQTITVLYDDNKSISRSPLLTASPEERSKQIFSDVILMKIED